MIRLPGLFRLFGLEGVFDELADGFGAGWDAVGPTVFIDLVEEIFGQGEDDPFRGRARLSHDASIMSEGPEGVNVPRAPYVPSAQMSAKARRCGLLRTCGLCEPR